VAVLIYHSVQDEPEQVADSIGLGTTHSTAVFREQMELIAQHFVPISLDEVRDFFLGSKRLPRRAALVTFDDGFADNYAVAAPILNRLGIPAAFYVTVEAVATGIPPWFCRLRHAFARTRQKLWQGPEALHHDLVDAETRRAAFVAACRHCATKAGAEQHKAIQTIEQILDVEPLDAEAGLMMTWDQVRALHRAGHTVGSHTLTHPNVAYLNADALRWELTESRARLADELGAPVVHFSYPSPILEPHWTERTVTITQEAGYQTAVTCTPGAVRRWHEPLCLKRMAAPLESGELQWKMECGLLGRHV
jgi:peptidoglycan/xylan/chitin deacetylase (PgdA/CDA1 family)